MIERSLHDVEDLVLHHPRLVADGDDNVAFRKFCHTQLGIVSQSSNGRKNKQKKEIFFRTKFLSKRI